MGGVSRPVGQPACHLQSVVVVCRKRCDDTLFGDLGCCNGGQAGRKRKRSPTFRASARCKIVLHLQTLRYTCRSKVLMLTHPCYQTGIRQSFQQAYTKAINAHAPINADGELVDARARRMRGVDAEKAIARILRAVHVRRNLDAVERKRQAVGVRHTVFALTHCGTSTSLSTRQARLRASCHRR